MEVGNGKQRASNK